jgi:uncharacterized membrane protein
MTVNQNHDVTLEVANPIRDMDPGDSYDFRATVTNLGNGDDQFRITLSGKNSNWATVDKTLINLNATEKQTVTIHVSVPISALSTDDAEITVAAVSNYGSASASDDIIVGVHQKPAMSVDIDVTSVSLKQGQSWDSIARITITNNGNGPDTFRVSFSGDITGYLQSSTPKVDLQPGESRDITLSVAVVENAPEGKAMGTIVVASTKFSIKQTLEFDVNIQGSGDDGGLNLFMNPLYIALIGLVVVIVVVVYFVAAGSRKQRPGNSVKKVKPTKG